MAENNKYLYEIKVTETWTKTITVEAEDEETAYDIVDTGISDGDSEYSADMGGDYHRDIEIIGIAMKNFDTDLYAIEETPNGKYIHIFGYAYNTGVDEDKPFRFVKFSNNLIPVGLSKDEFREVYLFNFSECQNYIDDYNEQEILQLLDEYFDTPPQELDYDEITPDTPCGYYISN